ncbi:MAG: hypothetical protein D6807_00370 [Alphaproteobacteria bacterium]|nr:MAG: hypothetical protein D6807_00370 [Alphaproteobacteria bacterium]
MLHRHQPEWTVGSRHGRRRARRLGGHRCLPRDRALAAAHPGLCLDDRRQCQHDHTRCRHRGAQRTVQPDQAESQGRGTNRMHVNNKLRVQCRSIGRRREGSVLVETALVLPVLILLLAGAYELGNFMLANQKVSGLSSAMADLIAQTEDDVAESEINDIFGAIAYISEPFNVVTGGRVIISAIRGDSTDGNTVLWQRCRGALAAASRVGSTGATDVTLPADIELGDGETAVLAEVYFSYSPRLFIGFFPAQQLRSEAIYRPRFGALAAIVDDGATPSTCGGG